jgi:hypothetical protein
MPFNCNRYLPGILCALVTVVVSQPADASPIVGGTTTFTADAGLESIFNALNVSATLIPPASGDLQNFPQTLILPITGGDTTTELDHAGGVIVQALGQTVDVMNIVIHISGNDANKVTADLSFQGLTENLAVADITGSNTLIIDPSFVAQIRATGGPDLTGTTLATFNSQPETAATAAPEPGQEGLIGAGLLVLSALVMRRRSKKRQAV